MSFGASFRRDISGSCCNTSRQNLRRAVARQVVQQHLRTVERLGEAALAQFGRARYDVVAVRPMEVREGPVGDLVEPRLGETVAPYDAVPDRLLVAHPFVHPEWANVARRDAKIGRDPRP